MNLNKIVNRLFSFLIFNLLITSCEPSKYEITSPVKQQSIQRVDVMPNLPTPFKIIDYNQIAKDYDRLVYDPNQTGPYWPLIWKDSSRKNVDQETYGIYTAMGDARQGITHYKGIFHESLASIGSVLGGSLVGVDKSNQKGENYVGMLRNYFNSETNWNIIMNNTSPEVAQLGGGYARDWWYDVYPNLMFYAVADFYPDEKGYEPILRSVADKFYEADQVLNGNYDYTFFDYEKMEPKKNWICSQQDAAAGHAYVLYAAYQRFKDPRYLEGAKSALEALLNLKENRFYEILMPFGAYVAARLNAEEGTNYDFSNLLDWTFDGDSVCREGWGVLVGNWNGYDISGIIGSTVGFNPVNKNLKDVESEGFGFLMNTYDAMWPLVPMVRYDQRYANTIGKWMLNAANASRLFYPYEIPDDHQTIPEEKEHTKGVIAYEGLINKSHYVEEGLYLDVKAPVAIGDGMKWNKDNPKVSQFSVYGSGHVGIPGAIISKTSIENILQLDLLATDFYKGKAYPSYLYYNPNPEVKVVTISTTEQELKIYDAIQRAFIAKKVTGSFTFNISQEHSSILVFVPQDAVISERGNKLYADDVVIDYHYNKSK
jgi:hypothetical protein